LKTVTENEFNMIMNIAENNFSNQPGDTIWANSLADGPNGEFINKLSFPGIISSLSKKGLVKTWGRGKDACVKLTEAGIEIYELVIS
jgi:hypothetical protein